MPENPIYDPNKIVKRAYTTDSYDSSSGQQSSNGVPTYDTSKIVKRGYTPREAFQEEGFSPEKYVSQGESVEQKIDKIITNNYPDISDDRRKTFKDYAMSGASSEDIKDAILTFQGINPKQEGSNNFYMEEVAPKVYKPIPLRADEKPPAGYDVASVWGDQIGSDDDNMVTSLAKHVWNGVVGTAQGFNSLIETSIGLTTGQENKTAKIISNKLNKFKFATKSSEKGSVISDKPITEFSDFFDPEQYDFSGNKLQGQILNGIESSISFAAGRGAGGATTKLANKALSGLSAYNMSLTELLNVADEAGLEGRDKYGFAAVAALPQALLESSLGTSGLLTKNAIARQELRQASLQLAKNLERNAAGELTEESLSKLQKEMSIAALAVNKKFASQLVGNSLEEAGTEFLQQFAQESSKQLYDKLSEDPKFNADAFSLESMGKYVESAIGGLLGSVAPSTAFVSQQRKIAKQQLESSNAYSIASKGDEAVEAFKIDIDNKIENGVISQEQGDAAKFKVDAYNNYNKTTENLSLTDENKEKLFKLSFQKENLKAAIKDAESKDTEGHSRLDKMNPAELGLHNAKVKQAKALQDEIDLIVSKSEVLQQPEVAEKVVEKVVKAEEKATEGTKVKEGVSSEIGAILGRQYKVKTPASSEVAVPGKAAYEVPKKVAEETRKMKEIPAEEWNQPTFDVTVKQAKLADALNEIPEKTAFGTLQQDNLIEKIKDGKKRIIQTFNVTLPNGKTARTASSMVRFPEEGGVGGFMGNFYEENLTDRKNVIGQKVGATVKTLKDSGRKVIFLWNADEGSKYGKHLAMVKESLRGKSDYSLADQEEMADLRMSNMGQAPSAPAPGIITPEGPTKGGPKVVVPIITTTMRKQLKGLKYSKAEIQAMTPQEANDIIKEQREKPKVKKEALEGVEVKDKKGKVVVKKAPKELSVEKKKSIAKREALMESVRGVSKLVAAYNGLTKAQKKSKIGVDLYRKIQDRASEIGYSTKISRGGTLQLTGEKGKRVYKTPVKRTEDQKAMEKERKQALGAEPTSIAHSVILDIANGLQFDVTSLKKYFSEAILKEMPSLLKNSKGKGISLEFYKQRYDESLGLKEPSNLDEEEVAQEAADVLGNYFMDNYRQAATEDAIDINFKTKNEGMSRSQVEDLNEMQKEQEREQKELENILAQEELTKEEYRKQAEEGDYLQKTPEEIALEKEKSEFYKEYQKQAEQGGYYQKAKVKPATLNKFEKSVDLFYKTKDADGASKKRSLAAERREFLEKNPTVKYIDDNMKYIYKQLEEQNIIERKGECP